MVNVLGSFFKDLQTKLIPIYALTKKGVRFEWTPTCQQAFEDIKQVLKSLPVLVMPNTTGLFQLQSDTSKIGCGAALFQVQNGVPRLCGYYSRKLPAAAQNYGITELELFGLTINITAFKNYLLHVFFEAYVDHSAIPWLIKAKTETKTTRIFCLLEILQKYHFAVKYQPGKEMYIADFLSHHPETHTDNDILPLSFEAFDSHRENFLMVTTQSMTKTLGSEKPADPVIPTSTSSPTVLHSLLPVHHTSCQANTTSSAVDWEALSKQLIEKAAEPKAEPEALLHEVLNPIPVEIDLRGHVPDTQTRTTRIMQPLPDMHLKDTHRLNEDMPKELALVRKTLPKQEELKPLLRKLMCTALQSYKLPVKAVELTQAYQSSPYFKDIVQYLQQGKNPYRRQQARNFTIMASDFVLVNGLLFKLLWKCKVMKDPSMVLCVPEEYVPQILYHYHDYIMSGHQDIVRTHLTVQEKYFFPNMFEKVQQYIRSCHLCQTTKASAKLPVASFSRIPVNFTPFDRMSMDIKDMPMSSSHYHKNIVFNCLAMQYTIACPLCTILTETVFDCLFTKIICVFGKPSVIITNQQSSFTSHLMERLTTVFGTQLQFVGKEHHGANLTERYIQSMNHVFKKYLEDTGKNWPAYLPPVCYALNTFVSPSMGFSP